MPVYARVPLGVDQRPGAAIMPSTRVGKANMLERIIRDARLSPQLYEEVEGDTGATSQAMMVVVLVAVATGIGTTGAGGNCGTLLRYRLRAVVLGGMGLRNLTPRAPRFSRRRRQTPAGASSSGLPASLSLRAHCESGGPPGNKASHLPGRLSLATRRHGRSDQTTPGLRVLLAGGGSSDSQVHRAG